MYNIYSTYSLLVFCHGLLVIDSNCTFVSDNRCEVGVICQTNGYNHELKVMTMPSGRSFCEHDMEKLGGKERSRERFRCLRAMQQLGLKEDEKVLFKCLVLFTLGKLLTVTFCFFICVGKCYSAFYSEICIL